MELQLDQFKVGDVLRVVGELEELTIEKVWLSEQGSYRWVDYETRSRRSRRRVIISVEYDDGEWETVLYDQFPPAHEIPQAELLPPTVNWAETTFRRAEKGHCTLRLVSDAGTEIECDYADYIGPDHQTIAIEVFGAAQSPQASIEAELFVGHALLPSDVQLYLPVDTQSRPGLIKSGVAAAGDTSRPGSTSFSQRQLVIVAVVIGVVVLFLLMAF